MENSKIGDIKVKQEHTNLCGNPRCEKTTGRVEENSLCQR